MVGGTPEQMGTAHGTLLREGIRKMAARVVYAVGGLSTLRSGEWFLDHVAEIERRTLPHTPPRFWPSATPLSAAAGLSPRDGRYANLFPEQFHCSGIALRGKATVGGKVLHARVLDYMRDIGLQANACVEVFMPEGRNAWMSLGYAGLIGTVTAMNEKGLAIGEMGGRGQGEWDGTPMTYLLRDIMERAATVDEALDIFRKSPRTCEYYYVVSDKSGAMRGLRCTPAEMMVLEPGQQNPMLPHVPEDTVLMSAGDGGDGAEQTRAGALRQDRRAAIDRDHQAAGGHAVQSARRDLRAADAGDVVRRRGQEHARLRRAVRPRAARSVDPLLPVGRQPLSGIAVGWVEP